MKKILSILLLCFCFSATAQTVDDWYFQPPPTDNVMSIVFINGNLIDFVGATLQAFIDNQPVSQQGVFDEDGLTGVAVAGTDNLCACDLADSGETIEFSILMNGETIVMVNVNPPVVYYANGFLVIDDNYELTLSIDGSAVVFGCTDAAYLEFDASANLDDASCSVLFAEGCTDGAAYNYDAAANTEDGSCLFTGCTDASADNYDSNANVDGYCQFLGCMDATACNYDANSNEDDATCEGLVGCMDPAYYEFDASVTCDNGSCVSLIIPGCMDEDAFNFNPSATEDDGSCVDIVVGCMNPAMDNFCQECNTDEDPSLCFFSDPNPWGPGGSAENPTYITANSMSVLVQAGVTSTLDDFSDMDVGDILFAVYETSRLVNDWVGYSEVSGVQIAGAVLWNGDQLDIPVYGTENVYDNGFEQGENITWLVLKADGMIYNIQMKDAQGNPITISWGTGELAIISGLTISAPYYDGCMDATAPNYKPLATLDDGSCEIPYSIGCMDEGALNFAGPGASPVFTNAENFGDVYVQNIGINLNSGYDFSSGIAANIHDQNLCQSQVLGCTNSVMFNYDSLATEDDGSCIDVVNGCIDANAFNYNSSANSDDGSCIAFLEGCTYSGFFNYNSAANTDDGSCVPFVFGCMDVTAYNYNELANTDDGSCIDSSCCCLVEDLTTTCGWSLDYDCLMISNCNVCYDPPCDYPVLGCTDFNAVNYNDQAIYDDGTCIIYGCMDAGACNYDSSSNTDDDTCEYPALYLDCNGDCLNDFDGDGICDQIELVGCTYDWAVNYNPQATNDDGSCIEVPGCTYVDMFNYDTAATHDDGSCYDVIYGCTDQLALNFVELTNDVYVDVNTDNGLCIPVIEGCMDPAADNYEQTANTDDGSCVAVVEGCPYPYFLEYNPNYTDANVSLCITIIVEGCMNQDAENFNPEANIDDGTCVVFGCMDPAAENYNPDATLQDDSCILYGCTNETADNYNDQSTEDDGTCIIYGCTLSFFPNYNPEATVDDLSCNPEGIEVYGCTDDNALNYISQANTDNGSCLYQDNVNCSISIQEEDIPLYLPEGWVLFGYTCLEPLDLSLGFESIVDRVAIVKDSDGNAYLPEWNFNGIGDLIYSRGYQIKMTEEITDFSFCPTLIGAEEVSSTQYQLGDLAEGGIVFYVDATGEHGLVAAQEDLEGTYEWGCYNQSVSGADSKWIGSGLQNTMDITNQGCETEDGGITAAQAALDAEINSYSDWYLPSVGELQIMYLSIANGSYLDNIGDFQNVYYWSSSEYFNYFAWSVDFDVGYAFNADKDGASRVRVIRAF